MTPAATIDFDEQLRLALMARAFPAAESDWDRDQIHAEVIVSAGPFRGGVMTLVGSHELAYLYHVLIDLDWHVGREYEITFGLREAILEISFRLVPRGHLILEVEVREDPAFGAVLHFPIEVDQTYLAIWMAEIREALKEFPPAMETYYTKVFAGQQRSS